MFYPARTGKCFVPNAFSHSLRSLAHLSTDVKPANTFLQLDAYGDVVSAALGDFGLAQDASSRWFFSRGTKDGCGLEASPSGGSPIYMAPEALGECVLYTIVVGVHVEGVYKLSSSGQPWMHVVDVYKLSVSSTCKY